MIEGEPDSDSGSGVHDSATSVDIAVAGIEAVDALRDLWLALHHHHRRTATLQPLVADEESWRRRRANYLDWLTSGQGILVLASANNQAIGYAMVLIHHGPDDTWPVEERYGEIYSLSVAPGFRGRGIGNRLLDRVDQELGRLGIVDVQVAVMDGNRAALRLYERRGFRAGETLLLRFGLKPKDLSPAP